MRDDFSSSTPFRDPDRSLDSVLANLEGLAVGAMPKQKPSAQIHVADGAGGMRQVTDVRFEAGEWPIKLVVPATEAEVWMAHLSAEAEERGWSSSSVSQLEATENSGTLSVHTGTGRSPATLDIAWHRLR